MNYKDPQNKLHFIDPAFAHMLPAGSVQINDEEAEAIRIANTPPPLTGNALLASQISALEATITDRRLREAILGVDKGWLSNVNAQIASLRASMTKT